VWAVTVAVIALGACGGDDEPKSPPARAGPSPSAVIRAWANTLRDGDVKGAARYFALPSVVSNGTAPVVLRTPAEVRRFNASLPCGAKLERTYRAGRYTAGVFRLTERPGPGRCGTGAGRRASTAFLISGGKIRQWRRLPDSAPQPPSAPAPVV
jgi:hypothetical protein